MQETFKKIKGLFSVPMLLVFVIICIAFLPGAINMDSAVFRSAIVVAFGVDMVEDEKYIIHSAINVSSTDESLSENTKLISATGNSISSAITSLSIQFGRPIRFGHTRFVLIGKKLAQKNVAVLLDGIIRTNKMRDTVQLIMCNANVGDVLNVGIEIKNKTGIKLSDIITYQSEFSTTAMDSNVDTFYKGYFSPSGISKLNCITLTDDYTLGITPEADLGQSAGGESGSDGGGEAGQGAGTAQTASGDSQEGGDASKKQRLKYISNTGEIAVFKNGTLVDIMPGNLADSTYWVNKAHLPQRLSVTVSNQFLDDAQIHFYVLDKIVDRDVFFYKNIPTLSVKISLTLGIEEIINGNNQIIPLNTDIVDKEVKCAIGREVRRQTGEVFLYSKEVNLDVLDINEAFYMGKYKAYKEYLASGKTTEDFIDNAQISIDVRVEVI